LNVALSRAKTLCILITSKAVLRPSVRILADPASARGWAFLRSFEERAWIGDIELILDDIIKD
jgi:superfamily I DNA and/or RNA helicase